MPPKRYHGQTPGRMLHMLRILESANSRDDDDPKPGGCDSCQTINDHYLRTGIKYSTFHTHRVLNYRYQLSISDPTMTSSSFFLFFSSLWMLVGNVVAFQPLLTTPGLILPELEHPAQALQAAKNEPSAEPRQRLGIIRVDGPDRKGIVAAFAQLLFGHGCGIVESEQHTDDATNRFFQRIVFDHSEMLTDKLTLEFGINEVKERLGMHAQLNWNQKPKKMGIMVSKYDHALWELLLRHQAGELDCEISCILSNHPDLQHVADTFGIPFHVHKVTKDTKAAVEQEQLSLLKETYDVDLVILARYMQIISPRFCEVFPHQVINIHHSFLPAFIGARPYHRAHERGVKLIGATAHYATTDLDEGPIIEQGIRRVTHRDAVDDLIRKGRILEKNTLVSAVRAHLDDRIIVYDNKCVVFDT